MRHADAEDVVAEAFDKVARAILRGNGPTDRFLPYLMTAVRSVMIDRAKRMKRDAVLSAHDFPTIGPHQSSGPLGGGPMERAFRSLPPRWQSVLWCTEVLQMDANEVGQHFGLTPNAASALAYRARTNLRRARTTDSLAEDDLDVMGTLTHPADLVAERR